MSPLVIPSLIHIGLSKLVRTTLLPDTATISPVGFTRFTFLLASPALMVMVNRFQGHNPIITDEPRGRITLRIGMKNFCLQEQYGNARSASALQAYPSRPT